MSGPRYLEFVVGHDARDRLGMKLGIDTAHVEVTGLSRTAAGFGLEVGCCLTTQATLAVLGLSVTAHTPSPSPAPGC